MDRHIEILLLDNDCVIIPGFGGFMAHHIAARKDESDETLLPPLRSIGFNAKLTINDSLLAQSYVETYDISYPEAVMHIEAEVRELRQRIEADGSYTFNGIGTISLNGEGNYEFEPCQAGLLTPSLYGLDSFRLPTLEELKATTSLPTSPLQGEEEGAAGGSEPTTHSYLLSPNSLWRTIAAACVAGLVFVLMPSPIDNGSKLLKSGINTSLLNRVMPKDVTTGQEAAIEAVKSSSAKAGATAKPFTTAAGATTSQAGAKVAKPSEGYAIVLASRVTRRNAEAYVASLHKRGFDSACVYTRRKRNKVVYGLYATREKAQTVLNRINDNKEFREAWVTYIK